MAGSMDTRKLRLALAYCSERAKRRQVITVRGVAHAIGLAPSNAHKYLQRLCGYGYLERGRRTWRVVVPLI